MGPRLQLGSGELREGGGLCAVARMVSPTRLPAKSTCARFVRLVPVQRSAEEEVEPVHAESCDQVSLPEVPVFPRARRNRWRESELGVDALRFSFVLVVVVARGLCRGELEPGLKFGGEGRSVT